MESAWIASGRNVWIGSGRKQCYEWRVDSVGPCMRPTCLLLHQIKKQLNKKTLPHLSAISLCHFAWLRPFSSALHKQGCAKLPIQATGPQIFSLTTCQIMHLRILSALCYPILLHKSKFQIQNEYVSIGDDAGSTGL
jgi:hypothetical protein